MSRPVLITGVSRDLGARLARTLASVGVDVTGVDIVPPRHDLGLARFVRADIRNPVIARVIADHAIHTVVHLAMVAATGTHRRSSVKEMNVIGTMQLLAACQKAESVGALVVQSSISVYGSSVRDPVRFTEQMQARRTPKSGFGKDALEIESYVRGLARRRPELTVTVLRLANLMGAGVESSLIQLLSLPVVPRVMGFDPRLQFLHPDDAAAALRTATTDPRAGTYNVGAPDVITLNQLLRMLGRPWVSVPRTLAPMVTGALRQARVTRLAELTADELDALTYGRVMDCTRFAETFGLRPQWTSRAAVQDFARTVRPGLLAADRWAQVVAASTASGDEA